MRWYLSDPTYLQIISSPFHQASRNANESAKKRLLSGCRKFPAYLHPEMGHIVKWPSSRPLWVGSVAIQMFSRVFLCDFKSGGFYSMTSQLEKMCIIVYVYKWRFPQVGVSLNSIFDWDCPWKKPSSYWGTPMTMEAPKCHWPFQYQLPSNILWEKRASWWGFVGYNYI